MSDPGSNDGVPNLTPDTSPEGEMSNTETSSGSGSTHAQLRGRQSAIRYMLYLVIGVALLAGLGVGFLVVRSSDSGAISLIAVATQRDGGATRWQFGETVNLALESPQNLRVDQANALWTVDAEGIKQWSAYAALPERRVAMVHSQSDGDVLVISSVSERQKIDVFDGEGQRIEVFFSEAALNFYVTHTGRNIQTCSRVSLDGEVGRIGRGRCYPIGAGGVIVVENSEEITRISRHSRDLTLEAQFELPIIGNESIRVLGGARLIVGRSVDAGDVHVFDFDGEEIWAPTEMSYWHSSVRVARNETTIIIVEDAGDETLRVHAVTTQSGKLERRLIEVGEVANVVMSPDGRYVFVASAAQGEDPTDWVRFDLSSRSAQLEPTPFHVGSLDFLAFLDGGDLLAYEMADPRSAGSVYHGTAAGVLDDIADFDEAPRILAVGSHRLFLDGDRLYVLDRQTERPKLLVRVDNPWSVRPFSDATLPFLIYRDRAGEEVLAALTVGGELIDLHYSDNFDAFGYVEGSTLWFVAQDRAGGRNSLYSVPVDGSSAATRGEADTMVYGPARPSMQVDIDVADNRFFAAIDLRRRECVSEGLQLLGVGATWAIPSVPPEGLEACLVVAPRDVEEGNAFDIVAESEGDLWMSFSQDGRNLATGDDVVDAISGEIRDLAPAIRGVRLTEGTYRIRITPYGDETVLTQSTVTARVAEVSDARTRVTAYVEPDSITCDVTVTGDPNTVDIDGARIITVCFEREAEQRILRIINEGPAVDAWTVTIDCRSGDFYRSSYGITDHRIEPGKGISACAVSTDGPLGTVEALIVTSAATPSRQLRAPAIDTASCARYLGKETLPLGRCTAGVAVQAVQATIGGVDQDGFFGPTTVSRLSEWQRQNGLAPTGVVDQATWDRLGITFFGGDQRCLIGPSIDNVAFYFEVIRPPQGARTFLQFHACLYSQGFYEDVQIYAESYANQDLIMFLEHNNEQVASNDDYFGSDPAIFTALVGCDGDPRLWEQAGCSPVWALTIETYSRNQPVETFALGIGEFGSPP